MNRDLFTLATWDMTFKLMLGSVRRLAECVFPGRKNGSISNPINTLNSLRILFITKFPD